MGKRDRLLRVKAFPKLPAPSLGSTLWAALDLRVYRRGGRCEQQDMKSHRSVDCIQL